MVKCALVIVNWNSWDVLHRCLEKVEAQSFRNFRVIVVDNASEQPVRIDLMPSTLDIVVIRNQSNLGFAQANNQAIELVEECELVCLLNPDAFPDPGWLQELVTAANQNPDVVAFGSRQLCDARPEVLDGVGDCYHLSGLVWRHRHGILLSVADLVPREIFSPCAAAALYRRSALASVGMFDEDYFCYLEDVDLGFRLRLAGHKSMYVPGAVVRHIGSATTGGQQSDFAVYHGHRNLVWTYVKNMPTGLFWLFLPLHLAMNIGTVLWLMKRGKGRVILRAKMDAIRDLPRVWMKRREIQGCRRASVLDIWKALDKRAFPRQ